MLVFCGKEVDVIFFIWLSSVSYDMLVLYIHVWDLNIHGCLTSYFYFVMVAIFSLLSCLDVQYCKFCVQNCSSHVFLSGVSFCMYM